MIQKAILLSGKKRSHWISGKGADRAERDLRKGAVEGHDGVSKTKHPPKPGLFLSWGKEGKTNELLREAVMGSRGVKFRY